MAIPTLAATGTAAFNAGGTVTPTNPAHAANNILFAVVAARADATITETGGGWTQTSSSPQSLQTGGLAASIQLATYWKRAAGAAETNPTFDDGSANNFIGACVFTVAGCVTTATPYSVTSGATGTTSSHSVTGATTTDAECLVFVVVATTRDAASSTNFSGWTNADLGSVTEVLDSVSAAGGGGGFGVATGTKAVVGAYGASTVTSATSEDHAYITVAFRPAAGATATITLTWTDTSTIEDEFKIERKDGGGAFAEIDTVAAGVETYDDAVATGETYTYRVRSSNANGNSAYSNEDAVIVP